MIAFHDKERHLSGFSDQRIREVGWAGVNLFFAISGLLICSRHLEEERMHGSISLRGFYIQRFFRIFPPAWLFLAVYVILGIAHQVPFSLPAALAAFLLVANYYTVATGDPPQDVYSDHFWSLSVEEHFYFILPAILVFVRRGRVLVLSILGAASLAWSIAFFHFNKNIANLRTSAADLQIHGLLFPALLAVLLSVPANRTFATKWLRPWFWIAVTVILMVRQHHMSPLQTAPAVS